MPSIKPLFKFGLFLMMAFGVALPAFGASSKVTFSGAVACGFEQNNCGTDVQERYVFSDTVGVEYEVRNSTSKVTVVRPFASGKKVRYKTVPATVRLAPGETGRFIVMVAMQGALKKRFKVCSRTKDSGPGACQEFEAISLK